MRTTPFAHIEPLENRIAPSVAYAFGIGNSQAESIQHIQIDASGNVYVSGLFQGTVDFDPGPGVSKATAPAGHIDGFIAKYTSAGLLAWVDTLSPDKGSIADLNIAVAPNGDVFMAATFGAPGGNTTLSFADKPDAAEPLIEMQVGGGPSIAMAKIDALGAFRWTEAVGDATTAVGSPAIGTDGQGNFYLAGIFTAGPSAGSLTIGASTVSVAAGTQNLFVAGFLDTSSLPQSLWLSAPSLAGGASTLAFNGLSMAVDTNTHAVTVGAQFSGGATFQVQGIATTLTAPDPQDLMVTQLDTNGIFEFADLIVTNGAPSGIHVAADNIGGTYIAGTFSGTTTLVPGFTNSLVSAGGTDVFILQVDASGLFLKEQQFGGAGNDAALSLSFDSGLHIHLGMDFAGSLNVGSSGITLTSKGPADVAIISYDLSNNFSAPIQLTGTVTPAGSGVFANPAATAGGFDAVSDSHGQIYVAGTFLHSLDFTPGVTGGSVTASGGPNGFVAHFFDNNQLDQNPQQPGVAFGIKGTGTGVGYDIVADSAGNTYVAGFFSGTVTFGSGTTSFTSTDPNGNIFVAKYSPSGTLLWADQVGMNVTLQNGDPHLDIHVGVDQSGNVYLSGEFEGTATLGTFTLNNQDGATTGTNHRDVFLAQLNPAGNFVWARDIGGTGSEAVFSMAVNSTTGQVAIGGTFASSVDFGGTGAIPVNGGIDAYIAEYSPSGTLNWVHQMSGAQAVAVVEGLDFFSNGDVAATGRFIGFVDFNVGGTADVLISGNTIYSAFVGRFSGTDGSLTWANAYLATSNEDAHAIVIDHANSDSVYVVGQYHGIATFGSATLVESGFISNAAAGSAGDAFLLSLTQGGGVVGATTFGGTGADDARTISIDIFENIYIGGTFSGTADFDPSAGGVAQLTAPAGGGLFVAKIFAPNLHFFNAFQIPGATVTGGGGGIDMVQGGKIFADAQGNTYVTGGILGKVNLDPAVSNATFTSSSGHNLLVAKFNDPYTADAAHPRSFHDSDGDILTVTVTGPGSAALALSNDGGDMENLGQALLSGTTLATSIKISVTKFAGAGTSIVDVIGTTAPLENLGSITLSPQITLGDGESSGVLHVSGEMNSIVLGNVNQNTTIKLGDGLPYHIPGNTGAPDTYNNHPNLTIGDIIGDSVLIDVTGDGTAGGVGGGGLGNVLIHSWNHFGTIQTTQSVGNFTVQTGDFLGTLLLDPGHLGEFTTANIGNMTIANGAWGGSGTEIEGNIASFSATAFLAGASIEAATIGSVHTTTGDFSGQLTLTSTTANTVGLFTVATDFTGTVISNQPLKKINIRGNFTGSLQAPGIAGITAFAFLGAAPANPGDPNPNSIMVTEGFLGILKTTSGIFQNYTISTPDDFAGISVNVSHLTQDTVGINNVNITAASIGNISVTLAADKTASGIHLTGIGNSHFITTDTGTTKTTIGSIGNIAVTLKGNIGVIGATGISNSTFDARVITNEFGTNPASTVNPLGNIKVSVAGAAGTSIGLDHVDFAGNTIGKTSVSVTHGKTVNAISTAFDTVSYTADTSIGAIAITGDATSTDVEHLNMWSGGIIGGLSIASKTAANGGLDNSTILAGQNLNFTGASTSKLVASRLKGAALGAVKLSGSLTNSNLVAGSNIGAVTVGGLVSGTDILAGTMFGADHTLGGGDDSYQRAASIAGLSVKGTLATSVISSGINPATGGFGDKDNALGAQAGTSTQSSSIGPIKIGGGMPAFVVPDTGPALPHSYVIQAAAIKSLSLPHLKTIAALATPGFIDLAGDGESSDDILVREVTI